jgi:hypothetical protein
MEEVDGMDESSKEWEELVRIRKRAGRIMSGLAVIGLIIIILFLIAFIVYPPDTGLGDSYFIITGPFLFLIGVIAVFFTLLQFHLGNQIYKGKQRRFVKGWVTVFMVLAIIDLVLTFIESLMSGFGDSLGNMAGALISLLLFGYFYSVIKKTWITFEGAETEKAKTGSVGTIYPKEEHAPRKIDKGPSVYTKDYTKVLEAERRRVKASHEEVVPAESYDFGTIAGHEK